MALQDRRKDLFIQRASDIIEANLNNDGFGVSELARRMNISRSNLHRRIKSDTGKSVSQFIRMARLNKALEILKKGSFTVSEVAYEVGFGSPNYFSKCFLEQFGIPPSEIMERIGTGTSYDDDTVSSPDQVKKIRRPPLTWMLSVLTVVLLAVVLFMLVKPFSKNKFAGEISIMVLPFHNDSPGQGDDYIINGLMDEILNNLSLIEELDVVSRTTSEKYRNSQKSISDIAREVHVDYILEGSGQTVFDTTRIRLQLIEPLKDRHLWARPFEREITLSNLFDVQEEVSRAVAEELKNVLNLRGKELIQKRPPGNLAAYEAYLQAKDLLIAAQYLTHDKSSMNVKKARRLLESALELDSSYANAFASLGNIFINFLFDDRLRYDVELAYSTLDSGYIFTDKALQYDPGNREALRLRGQYYQRIGNHKEANMYIEASFRNMTRSYGDYEWETLSYLEYDNYIPGIKSYLKFLDLKPADTDIPPDLVHSVWEAFLETGFFDLALQQADLHLALTGDYDQYYWRMSILERWQGHHQAAQEYTVERWKMNSSSSAYLRWSISNYIYMNEFDSAYNYMHLLETERKQAGKDLTPDFLYGWIYLERGQISDANYHLQGFISEQKKRLEMRTPDSQKGYTHLYLGFAYSILNDTTNTLKHIEYANDCSLLNKGWIYDLEYLSSFDFIRNTPQFKRIRKKLEKAYLREHRRISRLLRQNNYPTS